MHKYCVKFSERGGSGGEFSDNIKKSRKQNFLIDRITFAWCEGIEPKDINGHILTTNLRYSQWLKIFSSKIPGRGDLGLGEIKGRSSSTSFRNTTLLILKFFLQSSSKHLSSFILRHQRLVRPGFIQKRFFFRGLFLNDLWRQSVIAEFSRTDRHAWLFLRLISLLSIRFINEFDKFTAETTATAAVAENMSLTMDAMLAILIKFSCKHGMKWPSHQVNAWRNHEMKLAPVRVFPCKHPLSIVSCYLVVKLVAQWLL